ncbi:MAG TPA: transposase [Thermoplasmata archaeon]|nr:transposase [Thermoplasmata archaeon]
MRSALPRRSRLKASLHPAQYRIRDNLLDITIHRRRHVTIDLSAVRNPLFARYLRESKGKFGLSVTDRFLLFHFHTAEAKLAASGAVGVDVNMPSADFATSDGSVGSVDLRPVTRVQGAMARKRASIQRAISKDLRHQRAVLRRYGRRERNRVTPLLHAAANQLLGAAGPRNIIFEDLRETTEELLQQPGPPDQRRRLSVWTHGRLQRIVRYKSRTQVVRVNPRGTSSECPRCGGPLAHPSWRRATCGHCQVDYHRDRMAAVAILSRGESVLWGAAHPPNALNALLEAARWRPDDERRSGPAGEAMKGDEATAAECQGIRPIMSIQPS